MQRGYHKGGQLVAAQLFEQPLVPMQLQTEVTLELSNICRPMHLDFAKQRLNFSLQLYSNNQRRDYLRTRPAGQVLGAVRSGVCFEPSQAGPIRVLVDMLPD